MRYVGRSFIFDYPTEFTSLPEYTARRGSVVRVTRKLTKAESNSIMYEVVAADGWVGHAWPDELKACRCLDGPEWSGSPTNNDTAWECDDCGRVIQAEEATQ